MVSTWAAAGTAPQKAVERAEASPAVQVSPEPEIAQAAPPANGSGPSGDNAAEPAADDAKTPGEPSRESILVAFNRKPPVAGLQGQKQEHRDREQPKPATPQPRPQPRPQVQTDLSEAAIDELLAGFAVGNLPWPRRLLGPDPGHPDCRIPLAVLKRNRLA